MSQTALLNALRAGRTSYAWAKALGLPTPTVYGWFRGSGVGKDGLLALLRHYPDRREEIIAAFGESEREKEEATP